MRPGSTASSSFGVATSLGPGTSLAVPPSAASATWGVTSSTGTAAPPGPPTSTVMIGVPTSTVLPSSTSRSFTTPANGLGSSTSDFAVSISTMISLILMVSPGLTFHDTISASVSPSPTSGSLNCLTSAMLAELLLVGERTIDRVEEPVEVRQVVLFDPAGRVGGVEPAHPQHRSLEGVEAGLADARGDLSTHA